MACCVVVVVAGGAGGIGITAVAAVVVIVAVLCMMENISEFLVQHVPAVKLAVSKFRQAGKHINPSHAPLPSRPHPDVICVSRSSYATPALSS